MTIHRFLITAIAVASLAASARPASAQTVVVVHRSSTINDVKLEDLRRFFLGQSPLAANGQQAMLVELTPMRTPFYKKLLGLRADEVRRRWIGMVFRGDALALPFELPNADAVKKFVADHPGAVAFLDAADVDESVKALRVNGKKHGEPQYPLK